MPVPAPYGNCPRSAHTTQERHTTRQGGNDGYFSTVLDAAIAVSDNAARRAAAVLAAAGISSGPSGAASLAGARAALTGPGSTGRRASLAVGSASVIVLLSTEAGSAG